MNLSQKVALNTVLLVGGRVAVAVSGLIGTVVATRYLGRDDFGQLITAVTFVALFAIFTDFGVWTVAAREIARRPEDEQRILTAVSAIGLGLCAATILVALAGTVVFYGADDRELVRAGILITLAGTLITAPLGASSAHLTAHQRAVPLALGGLVAGLSFVVALGVAIAADLGFAGIAAAYAISVLANAVPPTAAALRRFSLRPGGEPAFAWKLLRSALPQGAILAITAVYFRIDIVLLSLLGTDGDVALYGVAYRVLEFLLIVPIFAMTTLFPEIARTPAHSDRLLMLVQGALSGLLLITVPMACVLIGFAPEVVRLAGGSEFDGAADVLRLLIVAVAFSFPATVFFNALVAMGRQGILIWPLIGVLTLNVALNAVLIGPLAAEGAALALVVTEAAAVTTAWYLFGRVSHRPRLQRPLRLAVAGLACGATVAAIRLPLDAPSAHPALTLVAGSAAATAVFVVAALALRAVPVEVTSAVAQLRHRRT
ncbi:MAG: flippase [Solirubrobacteraceae bacterium]